MEINYSELAIISIEKDVQYLAWKWYIPNYTNDEIAQELRLRVWEKISLYSTESGVSFRTWANVLMKNRLKNLLRAQMNQSRGEGALLLPLDNSVRIDNPLGMEQIAIFLDDLASMYEDMDDFLNSRNDYRQELTR